MWGVGKVSCPGSILVASATTVTAPRVGVAMTPCSWAIREALWIFLIIPKVAYIAYRFLARFGLRLVRE